MLGFEHVELNIQDFHMIAHWGDVEEKVVLVDIPFLLKTSKHIACEGVGVIGYPVGMDPREGICHEFEWASGESCMTQLLHCTQVLHIQLLLQPGLIPTSKCHQMPLCYRPAGPGQSKIQGEHQCEQPPWHWPHAFWEPMPFFFFFFFFTEIRTEWISG